MNFYWVKTNWLIKRLFHQYIWSIDTKERVVYLTFDDGPIPEITPWVLAQLQKYHCKATFFCIGDNVAANPEIIAQINSGGHRIGNHTQNHLNGWKTQNKVYEDNIISCQIELDKVTTTNQLPLLFRPPYGKIKSSQAKTARQLGYQIIMWDILSADFDTTITKEQCLKNVLTGIRPGSIIVFHDSKKAFNNLQYVLPKLLEYLQQHNFACKPL